MLQINTRKNQNTILFDMDDTDEEYKSNDDNHCRKGKNEPDEDDDDEEVDFEEDDTKSTNASENYLNEDKIQLSRDLNVTSVDVLCGRGKISSSHGTYAYSHVCWYSCCCCVSCFRATLNLLIENKWTLFVC